MNVEISAVWAPLLVAKASGDISANGSCTFPVLEWALKHSDTSFLKSEDAINDNERDLIQYAREKWSDFLISKPSIQSLLQAAEFNVKTTLCSEFENLVAADPKINLPILMNALFVKVLQNQKSEAHWLAVTIRSTASLWQPSFSPNTAPFSNFFGGWMVLDRESKRDSIFVPLVSGTEPQDPTSGRTTVYGCVRSNAAETLTVLTPGEVVTARIVDPRSFLRYWSVDARTSNADLFRAVIPSALGPREAPAELVEDEVLEVRSYLDLADEFSRASVFIERNANTGQNVAAWLAGNGSFDLPAAANLEVAEFVKKTAEVALRASEIEKELVKLSSLSDCTNFGLSYASLTAAVWAIRLSQAADKGIAYFSQKQQVPVEVAPWNASTDQGAKLTASHLQQLYYVLVRSGAGASASARSLNTPRAGSSSLSGNESVASFSAVPERVFAECTLHILTRIQSDEAITASSVPPANSVDERRLFEWLSEAASLPDPFAAIFYQNQRRFERRRITVNPKEFGLAIKALIDNETLLIRYQDLLRVGGGVTKLKAPGTAEKIAEALKKVFDGRLDDQSTGDLIGGLPTVVGRFSEDFKSVVYNPPQSGNEQDVSKDEKESASLARLLGCHHSCYYGLFAEKKLKSSRDVVRLGRGQFIKRFEYEITTGLITEAELQQIFSRAWNLVSARAHFFARDLDTRVPSENKEAQNGSDSEASDLPDLHTLFLQTDLPMCKWGDSLHGPAAYLVDILEFVRHRELEKTQSSKSRQENALPRVQSALVTLHARRPDLLEVDLTDANSQVLLPFIDLVCESLEAHVAGNDDLKLDFNQPILNDDELSAQYYSSLRLELHQALSKRGLWLGDTAIFSEIKKLWDKGCCPIEKFILRDRAGLAIEFSRNAPSEQTLSGQRWEARVLPQTTLSARELSAEPQYVNQSAYKKLAETTTGYSLPWSLGEAQIDAFLGLVQEPLLNLWALDNITAKDDAEPSLLKPVLSMKMQTNVGRLIFCPDQHQDDEALTRFVKPTAGGSLAKFLEIAELDFAETQALEKSSFLGRHSHTKFCIQPALGDPCSADATKIKVSWVEIRRGEPPVGSEVPRFLRLRRHLGWTVTQLDRALSSTRFGKGSLDNLFAAQLDTFLQLREQLRLSVDEALSIFCNQSTQSDNGFVGSATWKSFLDPKINGADREHDLEPLEALKVILLDHSDSKTLENLDDQELSKCRSLLASALRWKVPHLDALIRLFFGENISLRECNGGHCQQLFGLSVIQRAINKPLPEFVALLKLVGPSSVLESPVGLQSLLKLSESITTSSTSAYELLRALSSENLELFGAATEKPIRTFDEVGRAILKLKAELSPLDGPLLKAGSPADLAGTNGPFSDWQKQWETLEPNSAQFTIEAFVSRLVAPVQDALPIFEAESAVLLQMGDRRGATLPTKESLKEVIALLATSMRSVLLSGSQDVSKAQEQLSKDFKKVFEPIVIWSKADYAEIEPALRNMIENGLGTSKLPAPLLAGAKLEDISNYEKAVSAFQEMLWKACPKFTYLLIRPMLYRFLRLQRKAVISEIVGEITKLAPDLAWELCQALDLPAASGTAPSSVGEWLLSLDIAELGKSWLNIPVDLNQQALGRNSDGVLCNDELNTLWRLMLNCSLAAISANKLGLTAQELAWFEGQIQIDGESKSRYALLGTMSFNLLTKFDEKLETVETEDLIRQVKRWQQSVGFVSLWRSYPALELGVEGELNLRSLTGILDKVLAFRSAKSPANETNLIVGALSELTGWPTDELRTLLTQSEVLTPDKLAALLLPKTYLKIAHGIEVAARTGLDAAQIKSLVASLNFRHAQGKREEGILAHAVFLRKALRKRFTEAAWLDTIKAAQDHLRLMKRDALLTYILASEPERFADATAVSEHFLIDTQMGAVMSTSRVVQAQMAVQQFVQRCTMGLEQDWHIPAYAAEDWKPWKWMRTFRFWEACRKIFLYPENWMDPELRDDKSEFFEELENDLGQGELTQENADTAVIRYLHKLHSVARMEITASYYEFDADTPTMHVLARTVSEPRLYFYRTWIDERVWTPWEAVDLEISGDHAIVFKREGRIYIAWMTFLHKEVPSRPQPLKRDTDPINVQEPMVQWKIQLTTSERSHEGWRAKKVSPQVLLWPNINTGVPMTDLTATYLPQDVQPIFQDYGRPEILMLTKHKRYETDFNESIGDRRALGSFVLANCVGTALAYPPQSDNTLDIFPDIARTKANATRYLELKSNKDDLTYVEGNSSVSSQIVMAMTPGLFNVSLPQQATLLDLGLAVVKTAAVSPSAPTFPLTMGVALPFFYSDRLSDAVFVQKFKLSDEKSDHWDSRRFAREGGKLQRALGAELVQQALYPNGGEEFSTQKFFLALQQAQPGATPDKYLKLIEALTVPNFNETENSGRSIEVASRNYHPLACDLVRRAEEFGIERVYSRDFQLTKTADTNRARASDGLPLKDKAHAFGPYALGFDDQDAYAAYNWEVFFHIPFMIAMKFVGEGKFEEALRWFYLIFDPIAREGIKDSDSADKTQSPQRYWRMQRFYLHRHADYWGQRIDVLLDPEKLFGAKGMSPEEKEKQLTRFANSILEWRKKPNFPFQIGRNRWVAFQKALIYRFVETIIAWADSRFRIDTREEINSATQLYFLADKLLGRKPRTDIAMCTRGSMKVPYPQNYDQLMFLVDKRDDELSQNLDSLIDINDESFDCWETDLPDSPQLNFYNEYFCVPPNEKLLELWDRVADRLYKIHNSQNIEGALRNLTLFAPPIDPALLVRAGAMGLSIDQIVAGMNQPRAHYRFAVVLQKANELAGELRVLGGELLQALEKRDAEELNLLRSRLDLGLAKLSTDVRKLQIREATEQIASLVKQRETVHMRQDWYAKRVADGQSTREKEAISLTQTALVMRGITVAMQAFSGAAAAVPTFTFGVNGALGSPHAALVLSGLQIADSSDYFAKGIAIASDILQTQAGISSTLATYERRDQEWRLQSDLAIGELKQLDKQILSAEIRLAIAELELRSQDRSIENAEQVDEFLKNKFTNVKLYDWMVRQISGVYFKTYQMALDMARTAEDCLNRELPIVSDLNPSIRVIKPGHWDSLRKGLLAANGLIHDLKQLDTEYVKRNKRVPELTKHISLAVIDPLELLKLKATGKCEISIPDVLFDMDHPGQWGRRLKAVSISMPCIAGPFTSVSCELRLKSSRIFEERKGDRAAFIENPTPAEAIYTSSGVNDSGMFELNLRDERFLPFEGAGAESIWEVSLPELRQFDYGSISDVVLHMRYTANSGSSKAINNVNEKLVKNLNEMRAATMTEGLWAMVSLRSDAPDAFNILRIASPAAREFELKLDDRLARWGGQPLKKEATPVRIIVIGESTAKVSLTVGVDSYTLRSLNNGNNGNKGGQYMFADVDGVDLRDVTKMTIKNFEKIEDVVILIKGRIK
jgi:Tc toxin complex TcA C-terminal TcB-binding domain/Neuraminidase-like domain